MPNVIEKKSDRRLRERCIELARQGLSNVEIAQKFRLHRSTICLWNAELNAARAVLNARPIRRFPSGPRPDLARRGEAMRLLAEGLTKAEVARRLNASWSTVHHWHRESPTAAQR